MTRKNLYLCGAMCLLVAACASQSAPRAPAQPQRPRFAAQPAAAAPDADIASFFTTCGSAHTDSSLAGKALTGKDDPTQMQVAAYYLAVAQAYSSKEYTDTKWRELRIAAATRVKQDTSQDTFGGMANMLQDVQAQMIECSNYVRSNKASVEARVTQSGVLKQ